jgi:hypothetical protein
MSTLMNLAACGLTQTPVFQLPCSSFSTPEHPSSSPSSGRPLPRHLSQARIRLYQLYGLTILSEQLRTLPSPPHLSLTNHPPTSCALSHPAPRCTSGCPDNACRPTTYCLPLKGARCERRTAGKCLECSECVTSFDVLSSLGLPSTRAASELEDPLARRV